MPRSNPYTVEHLAFLEDQYQTLTVSDLAIAFNIRFGQARSAVAIKTCLRRHKITCGNNMAKGFKIQVMNREQYMWVKEKYPNMPVVALTEAFNIEFNKNLTVGQLKTFVHNHGINCGRTGQFVKGQPRPPGSGAKGPTTTSFKPGPRPDQERPMWSERIDGNGTVWLKVPEPDPSPTRPNVPYRWTPKAPWIWVQANGPKPPGHIITFKDADQLNCDLDNLICISRQLHFRLNKYDYMNQSAELRPSIYALAEMEVAMFNKGRVSP